MGLLVEGKWHNRWYDTKKSGGHFVRSKTQFRSWIKADGSTEFTPARDRYHLYVSYACPWASRALAVRKLKRLDHVIGLSIVDPYMGEQGWFFSDYPDCIADTVNHKRFLHQLYTTAKADYSGRVTVPVLWDKQTGTIVNNESSEIIRMLNSEFDAFTDVNLDLYPDELRGEIDELNEQVYHNVNNGVYRCGFATTQEAYEQAFDELFQTLDELERRLTTRRYLTGTRLTEADLRLFVTLVRFDVAYFGHFKCNQQRIVDYPNLWGFTRELHQLPQIRQTVNLRHIKEHYYRSHSSINPTGIVPKGPVIDFNEPHQRDHLAGDARSSA